MKTTKEKIKGIGELKEIVNSLKEKGKKIVFTNGCFDLLHVGHMYLLEQAKSFGDVLIVGLNTDTSVKKIKGESRPIVPGNERARIIAALSFVDYVAFFEETTPCEIISLLKPHVHVKGGDYNPNDFNNMPEAKVVKDYGGEVKIIKVLQGHSTTALIEKLSDNQNK